VVSDFENDGTLFEIPDPQDGVYESGWGRVIAADSTGIFSATPDTFSYVTEMNGNSALYFSPSAIEQSTTVVVTRLPHRIEVGDEVTFYGRAKIVDASAWQAFGLVNVPPHDIERDVWNSYGPMSKFSDELGELDWIIRDGSAYQYSDGEYPVGAWREFWMHVNNGTLDSGGQTSTVYMREDGRSNTPVMVYENALFRDAREAPMDVFMILGDTWTGRPGAVLFDDLYLIDGYTLDRPSGTGYGMYPSRRGWKENAWLGTVWDESFPWVFSESHGWWFAAGNDPQANWHFDSQLGWLWIAPDSYPYLYSATRVEWVYSLEVDGESRWFYGLTAKGWFSAPRNM
jgi:hypothetical protein